MVTYCCVKGCGNKSNDKKKHLNSVISFHAFPSNPELKTKWLRAIGRPNWSPPNYVKVCSAHFNYDQINYDGCRIRIMDDAYPVLLLPPNSNFEATNVETCRICLATDITLYSLQDRHLAACMESLAGLSQNNMDLECLPQYICYQCAPSLIKCNQLIETCIMSQATLLDIFAKNGQITKDLIKERNTCVLNLTPPIDSTLILDDYILNYDNINNTHVTTTDSNNEDMNLEPFDDGIKCKVEVNNRDCNGIDDNEEDIKVNNDDDVIENCDLDKELDTQTKNKIKCQAQPTKEKVMNKKSKGLTSNATNMLKYFNVVTLSLKEQIQEWEKSIAQRSFTSKTMYQCEICKKTFANRNTCQFHFSHHQASFGPAKCPVCKLRFKNVRRATSHAKEAHGRKFICKICPKTFNKVGVAKKHLRWHSGYMYKCDECPFSTLHESSLGVHKRRAHASAHACALCGRAFSTKRGLNAHVQTAHTSVEDKDITKEYHCEQCNLDFASEGARRVHLLSSIQHRKKLDLCDTSVQDTNLRNSCSKCGIECASFKELLVHMRAQHPRPRRSHHPWRRHVPYPTDCEICGETVTSRNKHWLHFRRQHPKEMETYQPVITAICDTCGKGFQDSTKLRLHQLRHRSPTVRCPRCPRLFYDKYAVSRHASTHDSEKLHRCSTCDKAFKLISNLNRHSRVHTDVAPYECIICNKKFKYSSSVNLHVRTVHHKQPHPTRKSRKKSVKHASD